MNATDYFKEDMELLKQFKDTFDAHIDQIIIQDKVVRKGVTINDEHWQGPSKYILER